MKRVRFLSLLGGPLLGTAGWMSSAVAAGPGDWPGPFPVPSVSPAPPTAAAAAARRREHDYRFIRLVLREQDLSTELVPDRPQLRGPAWMPTPPPAAAPPAPAADPGAWPVPGIGVLAAGVFALIAGATLLRGVTRRD